MLTNWWWTYHYSTCTELKSHQHQHHHRIFKPAFIRLPRSFSCELKTLHASYCYCLDQLHLYVKCGQNHDDACVINSASAQLHLQLLISCFASENKVSYFRKALYRIDNFNSHLKHKDQCNTYYLHVHFTRARKRGYEHT